jgi:hypothetical protein
VLYDEDTGAFDALLEAWQARFTPADATEEVLVRRLAEADWRLRRATRLELEMFGSYQYRDDDGSNSLALAMIRDGHGRMPSAICSAIAAAPSASSTGCTSC